jgi:hypothetical protein
MIWNCAHNTCKFLMYTYIKRLLNFKNISIPLKTEQKIYEYSLFNPFYHLFYIGSLNVIFSEMTFISATKLHTMKFNKLSNIFIYNPNILRVSIILRWMVLFNLNLVKKWYRKLCKCSFLKPCVLIRAALENRYLARLTVEQDTFFPRCNAYTTLYTAKMVTNVKIILHSQIWNPICH